MFMFAPKLLARFSVITLLKVSSAMTVIRWLLLAVAVESVLWLTVSQLLHSFTFGLVHAASIQFVYQAFDKSHQSQGQALYASLGFGLGGSMGIWICGFIWGDGSGAVWTWVFAAMCAADSLLALYVIHKPGSALKASDAVAA